MGSVTVSNKVLDKYFGYLKNLDIKAKKSLIVKLTESIESKPKKNLTRNRSSVHGLTIGLPTKL